MHFSSLEPVEGDERSVEGSRANPARRNLSFGRVALLIFVPSLLTLLAYVPLSYLLRDVLPALLVFFLLAMLILFPIQLLLVLAASRQEYGRRSLKSAFTYHQPLKWWRIALYAALLWGFAGLMTVTIGPLEESLLAPVSDPLFEALPAYMNLYDTDVLEQFSGTVLLLTAFAYLTLNGFVGPIIEELFFRGYLTAKLSRYGVYAPLIVTVLFSLYHWWLPFNNLFRIAAFLPAAYVAWRLKNIYIAIVFHILSNLVSSVGFIILVLGII